MSLVTHQSAPPQIDVSRRVSRAGAHCRNRVFEWCTASAMLGDGFIFAFWPHAIAASAFVTILETVSATTIALSYIITGGLRITALWCNGGWPVYGPAIRAAGAVVGSIAWGSMATALIMQTIETGRPPSPGIPVYTALMLAEVYSAYRAASDVRSRF